MLTDILRQHGIQQKDLAAAVIQTDGNPCSKALMTQLVKHGKFPKTTPPAEIWRQVEDFLKTKGVPKKALNEVGKQALADALTTHNNDGDNYMAKPTFTQAAKRTIGLINGHELFEGDISNGDDLHLTDDIHYLRAHLKNTALRGGFIAIISEPGGGKTTMANDLEHQIRQKNQQVCFIRPDHITVERLNASGIYDAIIYDVSEGSERPKQSMEAKARQARRLLTQAHSNGTRHILLIDEAQGLHPSTLKSLKRFWELRCGHQNLLGIVLIGQTELRRHLQDDAWDTREVALRCQILELKPLSATELREYLQLKFERMKLNADSVFEEDAYAALHARLQEGQVSFAYPQRINNLVTRVINRFAEIGGLSKIPAELVVGDLRLRGEM